MVSEGMILADRYEILSRIGTGGMSDVYKAQDTKLSRFVAIKVLKQEYAENANFVTKFHAEAQAAAGLIHSNIVGVYDVGEDKGLQYIVMELVEGITLKHYIEKKLRLSVKESISIAIQMAQGLECAHKAGIIHRDVKPQNVIISKDGKVKVTDFDIAKAATSETITSNVMGSVHYTSPEQARGGYSDEKSDIYSLGVVLFEMLTGRVPFDGDTTVTIAIQHIQDAMPSPREFVGDIPVSIEQIIFKCTEKNSDRRYSSMAEVIADLKQSLLTPDENFIKRIPSGGNGGATKMVSEDDIKSIKTRTGSIDVDESLISAYNRTRERLEEDHRREDDEERPRKRRRDGEDRDRRSRSERDGRDRRESGRRDPSERDAERPRRRPSERTGERAGDRDALDEFEEEEIRRKRREAARKRREKERAAASRDRQRTSSASRRSSQKGSRYESDDDMDDRMSMIMRGIAVVVGIIILILILFIARRVIEVRKGSASENSVVSENKALQDVTGQSFEAAKAALEAEGYVVQSRNEASEAAPAGTVIGSEPAAGSMIPPGYTVTLVVSSGTGNIAVPSLVNVTAAEAKVTLENLGLVMSVTQGASATVPSGSVISQSPQAGEMVAPGATVSVVISTGSDGAGEPIPEGSVAVPNIIGLTETQAKTALTASGLSWSSITEEKSDSVAAGLVISQSVEPDSIVANGSSVDFVLSLGADGVAGDTVFSQNVQAPNGYVPGTPARIVLTGNASGTVYGQKDVTEFPVTIQIAAADVNSADTGGVFSISYTARVTGTNDDGTPYTVDQQAVDTSQAIAFTR